MILESLKFASSTELQANFLQDKENVYSERWRCAHANETVPFASAVSVLRPLNVSQHFAVYPLFIYCEALPMFSHPRINVSKLHIIRKKKDYTFRWDKLHLLKFFQFFETLNHSWVNKGRFCNTIASVALIHTSIQSDYRLYTKEILSTNN